MRYPLKLSRLVLLSFCLVTALIVFQLKASDSTAAQAAPDTEAIEEIEEIQDVTPVEAAPAAQPGLLQIVGRMHPAVIHFPIAWLTLLLLIETAALFTGKPEWSRFGLYVLILTLLSFIPAVTSGLILSKSQGSDPDFIKLMTLHRNINLSVVLICVIAFILRIARSEKLQGRARLPYFLLILVSTALIAFSGHLGGKMVFGENYLPF